MAELRDHEKQPIDGAICKRFKDIAVKQSLYLIAPLSEASGQAVYNTQVVISPTGQIVHAYRKVHLAPGEEVDIAPGNSFDVFDLPWFKAGLLICFDNQFPESGRCLAVQGARVLFWPSYGDPRVPQRDFMRCVDNNVYLVGAGIIDMSCGLPPEAFARGKVVDPGGKVLVESEADDSFVVAELPLDAETGQLEAYKPQHDYLARRMPGSYSHLV